MIKFVALASRLFVVGFFFVLIKITSAFEEILISDCVELQNITQNLTASYTVINDIDCGDSLQWNEGAGFIPIGSSSSAGFCGAFDGQNYTISHLFINRPSENLVGLFAQCCAEASIHDAMLSNITVTGNQVVGGLVGGGYGSIVNTTVIGKVRGGYHVGGVIGYNLGQLRNIEFIGDIDFSLPGERMGGLAGGHRGNLIHGKVTGSVTGSYLVGGAVGIGYSDQAELTLIEFRGEVIGQVRAEYIGGLIGESQGTLTQGVVHANVSGYFVVGGGIGINFGQIHAVQFTGYVLGSSTALRVGGVLGYNVGIVNDTKAVGSVTGQTYIGGVCGSNFADITFSEFSGEVVGTTASSQIGGFVGNQGSTGLITNSKASGTVRGEKNIGGFAGMSSAALTSVSFDGNVIGETPAEQIGGLLGVQSNLGSLIDGRAQGSVTGGLDVGGVIGQNRGNASFVEFSGTVNGYELALHIGGLVGFQDSIGYLTNALCNAIINGTYLVGGAVGWNLGVVENIIFIGTVIGEKDSYQIGGAVGFNERTLKNVYIDVLIKAQSMKVGGAVGENSYTGALENITVIVDLVTSDIYAGGVVGNNLGNVFYSRAEGSLQAYSQAGGIAGSNGIAGVIGYSYAIVNVTAQANYAGGLVGYHEGVIAFSYSLGPVMANQTAGSLVGYFDGRIQESYGAGCVSSASQTGGLVGSELAADQVTEPYWNLDTTGQRYPAGQSYDAALKRYGLNTEQMYQSASFELWDYEGTWDQQPGESFPYLKGFSPTILPTAPTMVCPMEPLPYESWIKTFALFFMVHYSIVLMIIITRRIPLQNQLHAAFKDAGNWVFSEIQTGSLSLMNYLTTEITQSRDHDPEGYSRLELAALSDSPDMIQYWLQKLDASKTSQKEAAYAIAQDLHYTTSALSLKPENENETTEATTSNHAVEGVLRSRSVNLGDSAVEPLLAESDVSPLIDKQLLAAAAAGNVDKVKYCLKQGAEPNRRNQEGVLPVFAAAQKGHANIVLLLVEHGANPFLRNNEQKNMVEFLFALNLRAVAEVIIKNSQFSITWSLSRQIHLKAVEDCSQHLTELNLSGYGLSDGEFVRFISALKNNTYVTKFNVAYNQITVHGLKDGVHFLLANKTLSTLDLRCNLITLYGVCDFKATLDESSLQVILSDNILLPLDHQDWQNLTATTDFHHKPSPDALLQAKLIWQHFYCNALIASFLILASRVSSGYLIQTFDQERDHFHLRMTIALLCLSYIPSIYAHRYLYGGWWLRDWRDGVQGLLLLPSLSPELLKVIYQVQSPDIILTLLEISGLMCEILIALFAFSVIANHEDFQPVLYKVIITLMLIGYKCLGYRYWRETLQAQWRLLRKWKGRSFVSAHRASQLLQL